MFFFFFIHNQSKVSTHLTECWWSHDYNDLLMHTMISVWVWFIPTSVCLDSVWTYCNNWMVNKSLFSSHLEIANYKITIPSLQVVLLVLVCFCHCYDICTVFLHFSSSYQLKKTTSPWAPNTACSTWTSPNSPREQLVLSVCSLQLWRVLTWRNSFRVD